MNIYLDVSVMHLLKYFWGFIILLGRLFIYTYGLNVKHHHVLHFVQVNQKHYYQYIHTRYWFH
jgi:hypothetical protein